jgi:hypothetical protein
VRKFLPALALFILLLRTAFAGAIHATVSWSEVVLTTPSSLLKFFKSLGLADFDGDGRVDIVAVSQEPTRIVWYRNNGDGTFSSQYAVASLPNGPLTVATSDLDGDGRIDVVCTSQYDSSGTVFDPRITWFKNIGGSFGSYFAAGSLVSDLIEGGDATVAAADLDGDSYPELLATSYDSATATSKVVWHRNLGNQAPGGGNRFGPEQAIPITLIQPMHIRAADLDGDGFKDLVVGFRGGGGRLAWYRGGVDVNGTPQFTEYPFATSLVFPKFSVVADVDGDGYPDILSAGLNTPGQPYLKWFRQTPGPTSTRFTNTASQVISNYNSSNQANSANGIAAADVNSDGKPDAVGVSFNDDTVRWFENIGPTNYFGWSSTTPSANALKVITTTANGATAVEAADFNQDGAMDVVVGSFEDGKLAVHFNQGGQTALATTNTAPGALTEWRVDDVLQIVASNSGYGSDNNAQLFSVALDLDSSAGVPMTTAQANLLIDRVDVYADTNGSNAFEVSADTLVGRANELVLSGGLLTVPIVPTNPTDAQIAARATVSDPRLSRTFFVVARAGGTGSTQVPNTFRMTHRSKGPGRTVLKDATTGAALTVELLGNTIVSSGLVTVQPAPPPHTYTDYSYIYFADTATPGAGAAEDFDGDGTKNLAEFGFGIDPTVGPATTMVVTGGTLTQRGLPTVLVTTTPFGVDVEARFCRRKDPLSGLSYVVQFSADLLTWENSTDPPTVLADDGVIQAVSVPYPFFLSDFRKAQFFRVAVTSQ